MVIVVLSFVHILHPVCQYTFSHVLLNTDLIIPSYYQSNDVSTSVCQYINLWLLFVPIYQPVLEHIHSYVFQNSPEVDEEGYSIRPDEELEGDILHAKLFVTELLFFFLVTFPSYTCSFQREMEDLLK